MYSLFYSIIFIFIFIEKTSQHHLNQVIHSHDNQTVVITESATEQTKNKTEPIVSHDSLTANQISALREKTAQKKGKLRISFA